MPVSGGVNGSPIFGGVWFVDGTNGSNSNSGRKPGKAYATIQKALTNQIANSTGLGDVIYVFPGTYAESLTGTMNKVEIRGLQIGASPHMASIRPTSSYSYTGSMTDSAFRNLILMSPSSSNTEYAAIMPTYMGYSAIENCFICGRAAGAVVGIQIGSPTDQTTAVKFDFSSISNNIINTFYGTGCSFTYGIQHSALTDTYASTKQMWGSVINNNRITASTCGISIGCQINKCYGSHIKGNIIDSMENGYGPTYGIQSVSSGMQSLMVIENRIKAQTDGIRNFLDENVFGNLISLGGAAVVGESPDYT